MHATFTAFWMNIAVIVVQSVSVVARGPLFIYFQSQVFISVLYYSHQEKDAISVRVFSFTVFGASYCVSTVSYWVQYESALIFGLYNRGIIKYLVARVVAHSREILSLT